MRIVRFAFVLVALLLALPLTANAAASPCTFQLGFSVLFAAIPERVGSCLDMEAYSANGDSVQHTARGLLVWRRADNWTAFTDGYRTWINGPFGIQERLNTQRFGWELVD